MEIKIDKRRFKKILIGKKELIKINKPKLIKIDFSKEDLKIKKEV